MNEQIHRANGSLENALEAYLVLCECEDADCLRRLEVPARVYKEVRADSERFLVVAGHEDADVECVLVTDSYSVVRVRPAARDLPLPSPLPAA